MERFTRHRLIVPALLAASLAVLSALPASAWTQEVNEFDTGGTSNCGTKQSEPCLFWQEPHYTVVTLNAYLDPSLNLTYYDFHPVLTNLIFPNYNTDPAYNPSFTACTSSVTCGPLGYSMGTAPTCGAVATTYLVWQTPWFDPNHNGGEWNAYLQTGGGSQLTLFNGAVTWNSNFDWSFKCSGFDIYQNADGRKVAGHETGHESSLGHTSYTALMHQGPENFYLLQSNDIAGLKYIYPGNYP